MRTFAVWHVEYPEDGCVDYQAGSADEAIAKYRIDTGDDESELQAAAVDPNREVVDV